MADGFDIIGEGISGGRPSGIFAALDPTYQLKQQQLQQNALTLRQAQLFADGLPQDANGNTDWNAAYSKAMSAGAYDLANQLVGTGIRMSSLNDRSTLDDPLGGGRGGGSGSLLNALAGDAGRFAPAAGGGMIAPGAGGDDYGQLSAPPSLGAQAGGSPAAATSNGPAPTKGANPQVVDYIRSAFAARGVSPDVALAVGAREGLRGFDPSGNANPGDDNSSFGPFQLHYGNVAGGGNSVAGLGDDFTRATGLDARDPSTWKQQVDFVADHVAQNGWGAFHGARAAKIGDWTGVGQPGTAGRSPLPVGMAAGAAQPAQPQATAQAPAPPATNGSAAPASASATPAQPPVSDDMYATAKRVVGHFENADPSTMSLDEQRAVTMSTGLIDRYESQQGGSGATAATAATAPAGPVTDSQAMQARKLIQATSGYDPESLAPGPRAALAAAQATVARYGQEQATPPTAAGPASPGTAEGAPASSVDERPMTGQHPYAPGGGGIKSAPIAPSSMQGRQLAAAGQLPPGGALPIASNGAPAGGAVPAAPSAPQGGIQPAALGGAPRTVSAPGLAPTVPAAAAVPSDAAAALQRLRSGQGSAADAQLWGGYLKSVGGSLPAGQVGGPPSVGQGAASPSGPDLPNLPAGYQQPGGGTRYVNDVLAKAAQFATAGDPRAKVWEARANQVQAQLVAAQTFRNNLSLAQARADDRYNAANSPGAIAAAGAKAGAEATERNKLTLVPSVQPDGSTIQIPQSDALAAANAGKPIVSAQPGYVTQGQGNLLTKLSDGSKAYQERQVASQRLDALSSLLETYQTGANSTAFNEAAANAKSLGIPVPASATLNPAAMQEFTKNGYANVLSSMKEQGNKQYAAEVQAAVNSNPNPDLQPEANAAMIAQMQGTKRWYDQNFRDYSQWYHGNKGASDDADFQTSWTDAHPLGAYVAAAGKDIAPTGIAQPAPGKLVDGQAYMTAGGKMRWSASTGRMVPFTGTTAPALNIQGAGGSPPTASRNPPSSVAPVPGARQARDGNWYTPDPNRPGKYMMVTR